MDTTYGPNQLADALGIPPRYVTQGETTGVIPPRDANGGHRWTRDTVQELVARGPELLARLDVDPQYLRLPQPTTSTSDVTDSVDWVAYWERSHLHLLLLLTMLFPCTLTEAAPGTRALALLSMDTPAGRLTWHINLQRDGHLFDHVERGPVEWDGCDTEEKYDRIRQLASALNPIYCCETGEVRVREVVDRWQEYRRHHPDGPPSSLHSDRRAAAAASAEDVPALVHALITARARQASH